MKLIVAWYAVKDLDASKAFYGETLGMKKTYEMEGWCEFANAKGETSIGLSAEGDSGPGGATVVLAVDDIAATRASLEGKGVKFLGETQEIPGVVKLATFTDPSGNRLQLCQNLMPA